MEITTQIQVPDYDVTKWRYVPFLEGQLAEVGWKYCIAGSKAWEIKGASNPMAPACHYLRPIPQPEPIEPEDGYEIVPFEEGQIIQADWRRWYVSSRKWVDTMCGGLKRNRNVIYARPIPKPSLPPVPEGYEVVEDPNAIWESNWKYASDGFLTWYDASKIFGARRPIRPWHYKHLNARFIRPIRKPSLTFSEALEAMKQGKVVQQGLMQFRLDVVTLQFRPVGRHYWTDCPTRPFYSDELCATDWQVMEVEG